MAEDLNRLDEVLNALALAWNRLDPDVIEPFLSENVRYESLDTELRLEGKPVVLEYLRHKVELIETVGDHAKIKAQLGWVPVRGGRRPCVISSQGGTGPAALFFVSLDNGGSVDRILLCTTDPDPRTAEIGGVTPA